jgi:DNA repair protein RecO (recombination protein O)
MPQLKSEGLVLKSVNWKENSRVITVFSENLGRQTIIDRGGRSLKSRRGRLMTFSRLDLGFFKSDRTGTGYISEVEPLESFRFEKEGSLGRLAFASAAIELLFYLLPEDEPLPDLYHLTIRFFRLIDECPKKALFPIFLAYFMKMLSQLGYRPNLTGCVGCGKEISSSGSGPADRLKGYLFSPARGGLVCPACQIPGDHYIRLQSGGFEKARRLQTSSLREASAIEIKYRDAEQILDLLTGFLKYQTEAKEIKSLEFLHKLKEANFRT